MDKNLPLVAIVLSTYNGERFLEAQMQSLLAQTYQNIQILVRDDGSTDRSLQILESFARDRENVKVLADKNVGVVSSFLRLLNMASPEAAFVALCDQDDVWREDKIERALSMLANIDSHVPAMYCSALEVVDEQLNPIRVENQVRKEPSLENALVQNVATGCTTVLNEAAARLVAAKDPVPERIGMHDWWLYQVISCFGRVVFDDVPKIRYRQHGQNVIGSASGVQFWLNRVKRHFGPKNNIIKDQAAELLRLYGDDMPAAQRELVREFVDRVQAGSVWKRLTYALRSPVYRQSSLDDLILRSLMVISRV